ncbi:MAG TPA: DEAD/DEAH box helicase [Candidatus Obscuribacterales bacterium]
MAILHGNWLLQNDGGCLFIWGETWRRMTAAVSSFPESVPSHPLAMTQEEFTSFMRSRSVSVGESRSLSIAKFQEASGHSRKGKAGVASSVQTSSGSKQKWEQCAIALPTPILETGEPTYPAYSASTPDNSSDSLLKLQLWQVGGYYLNPLEAIKFLQALPLGSFKAADAYVGGELRFWSQVCRWSLDLLARSKFLPGLHRQIDGSVVARWQPLLDSAVDQARLEKFAQQMPSACRTYQLDFEEDNNPKSSSAVARSAIQNPKSIEPQELLLGFLSSTIDAQVRSWGGANSLPSTEPLVSQWLQALSGTSDKLEADSVAVGRLEAALRTWTTPVQEHLVTLVSQDLGQNLFRTCLLLKPPVAGVNDWTLEYCLQAVDNPEFLVDAETIWNQPVERFVYQDRTIEQPHETFLKGLGLALRLYPLIEPSLREPRPLSCRLNPIEVYEFIKASAWRLQDNGLGVLLPPSLMPGKNLSGSLGLKISADVQGGKKERLGLQSLLKFNLELAIGDKTLSKKEFDRLMALKTPLVEVNGEWIALQPQDVRAAEAILATRPEQLSLSVEDALRLSTGDSKTIEKLPVVSFEASGVLKELITNLTNNQAIAPIEAPASFRGELRPYQARGVGWLAFLERWGLGACLADDMGLGKTPQTIAFLLHLQEQGALEEPTLIVCPTSVLSNWEREVHKFGPTLKTLVHHGDKRQKGKAFAKAVKGKDVVITSYPLVYRDAKTLETVSWQGVVLDEAQNIKNPEAKQSQAVRQLPPGFRIALTGTPVENRLSELWSILDFLNPGYLGTRQFFQRRFAIPIEKYGDTDSLKTLRSLVQSFILRRLKTDRTIIQDLPEKQEMNVFCGLSAEQATLYQKIVDESLGEIEEAEGIKRRGMILTLLLRLKQICNHPAQYLKENTMGNSQRSGKVRRLEEMLEEAISEGDRALIFTQFAESGKLLQPYLQEKLGWETLFLYGSTRKQQREEMIDRFQNDPEGPRIFILSLKAGGTGLNLTRANHVFHFDRWWNPAVENQATDRVFRIGQTRNVQVHKFICTGTLEERINEMMESKKQLAEQTVDAGEQWLTELDTNQLRSLLLLDRSAVIDEEE